MQIIADRATLQTVLAAVKARSRSEVDFRAWKQQAEFEIGDDPTEDILRPVSCSKRGDKFHEYLLRVSVDGGLWSLTWEFEWQRGSGKLYLLDLRIVEPRPKQ